MLRQKNDWIPTCQFKKDSLKLSKLYNRKVFDLDITDFDQVKNVFETFKPDYILNLAAQSRPDISWKNPCETINSNIIGTLNILSACNELKIKPIILLASTSAQYGDAFEENISDNLIDENSTQKPINPYGVSKSAAEKLAKLYSEVYRLDVRYARIFNTSGYGKIGDVISDFTKRIVETKEDTIKVGNLKPLRCFLHVEDTLNALKIIMKKGISGEAYNICASQEYRVGDILRIVGEVYGREIKPSLDENLLRPTDEPRIIGSSKKLINLGWKESYVIQDIVSDCIKFHMKNL